MRLRLSTALLAAALGIASGGPAAAQFQVDRASDWEELFYQRSGWSGADGGFAIPLSGVYAPGTAHLGPTLFTYGDTWVGGVDKNGKRLPGSTLVNNSLSYLPQPGRESQQAAAGPLHFLLGRDAAGQPQSVFLPDTPNAQPGDWYWPSDGFANQTKNGDVYVFLYRLRQPPLAAVGVSLAVLPVASPRPIQDQRQLETPLFRAGDTLRDTIGFGNSVIVNTAGAGAHEPDGYLYVYGHEESIVKQLLVCRVRPEDIEKPTAWRFWNGADWVPSIEDSAPLLAALTGGISVEALPGGRVIALYMDLGGRLWASFGEGVTGPFGARQLLYRTPEIHLSPSVITYNPIAHPHLSEPGELLIEYSVNSLDPRELWLHADWYLPKFIRVRFANG